MPKLIRGDVPRPLSNTRLTGWMAVLVAGQVGMVVRAWTWRPLSVARVPGCVATYAFSIRDVDMDFCERGLVLLAKLAGNRWNLPQSKWCATSNSSAPLHRGPGSALEALITRLETSTGNLDKSFGKARQ